MSCQKQTTKKYVDRPSPPFPANNCPGSKKRGNDNNLWVSTPNKNGVHRWVRCKGKTNCKKDEIEIKKKGYKRKAYTRSDGTHVKATTVKPTTYCIKDKGNKGKTSRGAKSGPYTKSKPWITKEGKLGGPGYLSKSAAARHELLDKCVKKYGYRSCLGSVMVLNRNKQISEKYGNKIESDKNYLKKKYGKNK